MDTLDRLLAALLAERGEEQKMPIPPSLDKKRQLLRILMNTRPPVPLDAELSEMQDRELRAQIRENGIVDIHSIPRSPIYQRLALWQGNITRLNVDAIVNAANSKLLGCFLPMHNCIDNSIHSLAGMQLREECNRIMQAQGHDEPVGHAKITRGYNLPAKYIIHTVGPTITGDAPSSAERRQLAECYRQCMILAEANMVKSIAFCCISTGVFRFPQDLAAEIAVSTVLAYLDTVRESRIGTVIFDVFKDSDFRIYGRLLGYPQI